MPDNIHTRIKTIRKHLKLTQNAFGAKLGVDGSTISAWEKNGVVSEAQQENLATTFGVSKEWLASGQGECFLDGRPLRPLPAVVDSIQARFQRARKALKFTQKGLAQRLEVSEMTIVGWEKSGKIPEDKRPRICRELGLSLDWLNTGKGEMFDPNAGQDEDAPQCVSPREFALRNGCSEFTATLVERLFKLSKESKDRLEKLLALLLAEKSQDYA